MRHNFPVPEDGELENLITGVLARLPAADPDRLAGLESRILHAASGRETARRSNKLPWWLVLLLAAGVATAAWWSGETGFMKKTEFKGSAGRQAAGEANAVQNETRDFPERHDVDLVPQQADSPVIYRRENN